MTHSSMENFEPEKTGRDIMVRYVWDIPFPGSWHTKRKYLFRVPRTKAKEFIRRFAMHILPKGFVRIRHYGIVSSTSKAANAIVIKEQLPSIPEVKNTKPKREIYNPLQCLVAKKKRCILFCDSITEDHRQTGKI